MSLKNSNTIQVLLMEESELEKTEWIELYSQKFREIVEGGIQNVDEIKFHLYEN